MIDRPGELQRGLAHLRMADPVLAELMAQVGPFTLKLERNRFRMLVRSIISQQISTKAARSIRRRVEALLGPGRVTAEKVVRLPMSELRDAGLSAQKASYLLDLAERVNTGRVRLRSVGRMSDEEVIAELTQVKGIGRWTAQMFLMFSLGRPDIFPHDDLGIRAAIRDMYDLNELPDKETSHRIAEPWRPYATIACWYCWRRGDLKAAEQQFAAEFPG